MLSTRRGKGVACFCCRTVKEKCVIKPHDVRHQLQIHTSFPHTSMDIVWFLIIGGIAGWIAGEIVRGDGFGIVGNIVVGIVGAVLGGMLFNLLDITAYGLLGSLVMAVIGAVVLLFILNAFRGYRA